MRRSDRWKGQNCASEGNAFILSCHLHRATNTIANSHAIDWKDDWGKFWGWTQIQIQIQRQGQTQRAIPMKLTEKIIGKRSPGAGELLGKASVKIASFGPKSKWSIFHFEVIIAGSSSSSRKGKADSWSWKENLVQIPDKGSDLREFSILQPSINGWNNSVYDRSETLVPCRVRC